MRTRRPLLVAVSLSTHLVVVLALFVAGFWRLDRLDAPRRTIDLAVAPPPPPAPAGSPAAAEPQPFTKKQPRRVAREVTQPPRVKEPDPTPVAAAEPSTGGGGTGSGDGSGSGTDPDGTGTCVGETCGPADPTAKREPERTREPVVEREPDTVIPTVIRGMRVRGETQIQPPDLEKTQLMRSGKPRATATVKVCVAATGSILSVAMARGSGLPGWDAAILAAMRRWEYRPHRIDGRAVAVCGMVTFLYEIR